MCVCVSVPAHFCVALTVGLASWLVDSLLVLVPWHLSSNKKAQVKKKEKKTKTTDIPKKAEKY